MRESNENESVPPSILSSESFGQMQFDFQRNFSKNLDDLIGKEEILNFLDYNSPQKNFDRNYANKMFSILLNNPKDLTVKSFISNYLYSIEELKISRQEFENRLNQLQQEKNIYLSKILNYKNEPVNENGDSTPNLVIIFDQINFMNKDDEDNKIYHFTIQYNDKSFDTKEFTRANPKLNQIENTFEFENIDKNETINLTLKVNQDDIIRELSITNNTFFENNQEEFEIDIGVKDDDLKEILNVSLRGIILDSFYNYYNNLLNENKSQIDKCKNQLNKTQETINTLTNLKCFKGNNDFKINQKNVYSNESLQDNINDYKNFSIYNSANYNINNIKRIETFEIVILMLLNILNMIFGKTDYINFIVCGLFIFYLLENNNENTNYKNTGLSVKMIFNWVVVGSFIYDALWFIFNFSSYFFNGFINTIVLMNTIIIIIGKVYLQMKINKIKLDIKNLNR